MFFAEQVSTPKRIADFPKNSHELNNEVIIQWNDYLVPYIYAKNDHDLAYTLGVVQGYLRGEQVQFLKRVAYARLGESGGPFTSDIDHLLAVIDFPRASEKILDQLPDETRNWLQAFTDGFNFQMLNNDLSSESKLLRLAPEPITVKDILAIGRVIGTDINWGKYASLLKVRRDNPQQWDEFFSLAKKLGFSSPSQQVFTLLNGISKSGSNAIAVSKDRSTTGPLLVADPHLGFSLPNPWLLVGLSSPGFHAVGGALPALPFIAFGRNKYLAWSGTNMRSASSELYAVSENDLVEPRVIQIRNRFWRSRDITIRESRYGPVISDHPFFPSRDGELIALKWYGHETSDEISAFLSLNRASNVKDIPELMKTFGVSGQHIIAADSGGNIGHIPAIHLPKRGYDDLPALVLDPKTYQWQGHESSTTLESQINPNIGYVSSANNQPDFVNRKLGYFFSVPDRSRRIKEIFNRGEPFDIELAKKIQTDTTSPFSRQLARDIYYAIKEKNIEEQHKKFIAPLAHWDGNYDASSYPPVIFEIVLFHLTHALYKDFIEEGELISPYNDYAWLVSYFPRDLRNAIDTLNLNELLDRASDDAKHYPGWGDMHFLRSTALYGNIPYIGKLLAKRYEFPVGGSRQTLMKTNHELVNGKHRARYGSQSRQISDLGSPDENYFVLLGGQDGRPGSDNYADQLELWKNSQYIQIPLSESEVKKKFPWMSVFTPNVN